MEPIYMEVVAPVATSFYQGPHCESLYDLGGLGQKVHAEIMSEYPDDLVEAALLRHKPSVAWPIGCGSSATAM